MAPLAVRCALLLVLIVLLAFASVSEGQPPSEPPSPDSCVSSLFLHLIHTQKLNKPLASCISEGHTEQSASASHSVCLAEWRCAFMFCVRSVTLPQSRTARSAARHTSVHSAEMVPSIAAPIGLRPPVTLPQRFTAPPLKLRRKISLVRVILCGAVCMSVCAVRARLYVCVCVHTSSQMYVIDANDDKKESPIKKAKLNPQGPSLVVYSV